jgi:TPR repeat protein
MLSLMYSGGEGVPEDHKEAVKWIRRAAEAGHEDAQFDLGWLYDSGSVGVPQDHNEAVKWYRRAAEQGNAKAQYNLGQSYVRGEGVPEDYKEAVKWFRRAAEQGLPDAQHSLGVLYDHGGGVPQNPSEAAKWYQRAGEQGFPMAQKELGRAYALGRGVPEDLVAAYMWFNLAASQQSGSEAEDTRRLRDIVAAQLTPSQLATAQRLSREWRPKPAVKADSSRSSSVASRPSQPVTNVPESAGSGSGVRGASEPATLGASTALSGKSGGRRAAGVGGEGRRGGGPPMPPVVCRNREASSVMGECGVAGDACAAPAESRRSP